MLTEKIEVSDTGVRYDTDTGMYEINRYFGTVGTYDTQYYRHLCQISGFHKPEYKYTRLFIEIKTNLLTDAESNAKAYEICYAKSTANTSSAQSLYTFCGNATVAPITRMGGMTSATYEITDPGVIEYIMQYGFVLKENRSYDKYVTISGKITIQAYYYEETSEPEIYVTTENDNESGFSLPELNVTANGNVSWYQRIDRDMRLRWDYMQPFHAQASYEVGIEDVNNYPDTSKIETILTGTTQKAVVINRKLWQKMVKIDKAGNIMFLLWVRVTASNGEVGEWKYIQVHFKFHTLEATVPDEGTVWRGEDQNTIEWKINNPKVFVDDPPDIVPTISGYAIYISADEGATYAEIAETLGSDTKYVFQPNTLPPGKLIWKSVPLYDNNAVESVLSTESVVIVRVSATTGNVTCDGKPIPTVSWQSVAQASYQIRFGDYDSGAVYSSETSHKVPFIFSDGVYEVSVRTQIPTGEWSDWSEPVYVQITNVPPGLGITATAEPAGYRVKVVWTKNSGYVDYIVYRNGVPIHVTDGGISTDGGYMDSMANGESVYRVRGITEDGYYDQSTEITVNAAVSTDILFVIGSDEILPLKYTPVFPRTYNYMAEMAVTYRYFAGRSKPVAITSGQISRTLPLSYIDKGRTLARKLLSYVGKTVVFKDSGGDMIVGVLNMANAGMGHVSTTSFQITEVDYNERVEYLPGE